MESINASQYVRPLRIVFLINKKTYLKAVKYNTCLWGGIYNPILPVNSGLSLAEKKVILKILSSFDPDFVVNLTENEYPFISSIFPNRTFHKKLLNESDLFEINRDGEGIFSYGLSAIAIYSYIRDKEIKDMKENSNAILISSVKKGWENYSAIQFGAFIDDSSLKMPDFLKYYQLLRPEEIKLDFKNLDDLQGFYRPSLITMTDYDLDLLRISNLDRHILYLGNHKNWRDLLTFWNLRALGKDIIFVPYDSHSELQKTIEYFLKESVYPINDRVSNFATIMASPNISDDQFEIFKSWVRSFYADTLHLAHHPFARPDFFGEVGDLNVAEIRNEESEESLILADESITPFRYINPSIVGDSRKTALLNKDAAWANVVNFSGSYRSEYTFIFPLDKNVEEIVLREFLIGGIEKTRLSRCGIVTYRKMMNERCWPRPVKSYQVIEALFKTAGLKIKPSNPGILTENIIRYMGDLDNCRVFKIKGAREALKEINKNKKLPAKDVIKIIGNNWNIENNDLVIKYELGNPLNAEKVFQYLVDKKLIKPGFVFKCIQCQTKEFYLIDEFGETFKCKLCSLKQDIPRLDKMFWNYATNGFMKFSGLGFGSVSVIVALWRLDSLRPLLRNAQWQASINISNVNDKSFSKELDYVYLITDQNGKFELVLGESRGLNDFTQSDITKLRKIGLLFKNKPYLSFSTLKDSFTVKEKTYIKQLVKLGFPVIALTRLELDPYDLYERFDSLPNKYAVTLEQFAENTRLLNLT